MSRFVQVLRETWLVCNRNKLPRDLRNKLVRLVARNVFDWETEELAAERLAQMNFNFDHEDARFGRMRYKLLGAIILHVEECPEHPFPVREDRDLVLTRIRAKRQYYVPQNWFWMRLR